MLTIFDSLRDITMLSVFIRLILAAACGGAIGLERTYKRRPAGFRTHILVCIAAAITTLTSQYLYVVMHYYTDMARLGAQVIAGMGFIGAGTIIVTRRNRVKGLTTAAGLWGSAIVGLAIGAGFFEGGLIAAVLIMIAEILFSKIEDRIMDSVPEINFYVEYSERKCIDEILGIIRECNIKMLNLQITGAKEENQGGMSAIISLRFNRNHSAEDFKKRVSAIKNVITVYEL